MPSADESRPSRSALRSVMANHCLRLRQAKQVDDVWPVVAVETWAFFPLAFQTHYAEVKPEAASTVLGQQACS